MAKHVLNKAVNTTWVIDKDHDTWILGEKGKIVSGDYDGIATEAAIAKATVKIFGEIDAYSTNEAPSGIRIQATDAVITIGQTGVISARDSAINCQSMDGSVTINNFGALASDGWGIVAIAPQNDAEIHNAGTIKGGVDGIAAMGAGAEIINSCVIRGGWGIELASGQNDNLPLDADNATHIVNTGRITGSSEAVHVHPVDVVAVNIRNKGTLNGDVRLLAGQDVVNNRGGTINGDVWLGSNNDVFDGRGGRLNGVLYGGDGHDVVTLASPATLYVELANEGADRVRINATYRLGANVEDLQLLGKASHTGIGNSLSNWIYGNKGDNALYGLDGNDMLTGGAGRDRLDGGGGNDAIYGSWGRDLMTGGAGADYFGFYSGYGRDTITDFEIGNDVVGLTGIDGIAGFADLDGRIVQSEANPADTIIRLNDTTIIILSDTIAANLTANDFDFH